MPVDIYICALSSSAIKGSIGHQVTCDCDPDWLRMRIRGWF